MLLAFIVYLSRKEKKLHGEMEFSGSIDTLVEYISFCHKQPVF